MAANLELTDRTPVFFRGRQQPAIATASDRAGMSRTGSAHGTPNRRASLSLGA